MTLQTDHENLEKYFAIKYTKKYIELGGYFYIKDYKILSKSPMQKYFISGKYKELQDPELESYWSETKKHDVNWFTIAIPVLFLVVLFAYVSSA